MKSFKTNLLVSIKLCQFYRITAKSATVIDSFLVFHEAAVEYEPSQ